MNSSKFWASDADALGTSEYSTLDESPYETDVAPILSSSSFDSSCENMSLSNRCSKPRCEIAYGDRPIGEQISAVRVKVRFSIEENQNYIVSNDVRSTAKGISFMSDNAECSRVNSTPIRPFVTVQKFSQSRLTIPMSPSEKDEDFPGSFKEQCRLKERDIFVNTILDILCDQRKILNQMQFAINCVVDEADFRTVVPNRLSMAPLLINKIYTRPIFSKI